MDTLFSKSTSMGPLKASPKSPDWLRAIASREESAPKTVISRRCFRSSTRRVPDGKAKAAQK
jgi:hypothetical protein